MMREECETSGISGFLVYFVFFFIFSLTIEVFNDPLSLLLADERPQLGHRRFSHPFHAPEISQ
jgi:hypothetical protein